MPRRSLVKTIPSAPEVIDVLANGSEKMQKDILAPFLTAARMIPLRIDIWHNLERIFFAGVSGDEHEVDPDRFTTQEKELYARILDTIPILAPVIEACADKEREFEQFVKLISESALNSRTSDTHTIKEKVLLYIPATTQLTRLKLNFAVSTDMKAKRGWTDPQCASLLIPPRFQDEFCAGPLAFMAKARSSQIKIFATEFPTFLYADASKYDKNKPYRGLLKGPILVRVFRCIFTGPSTAMQKDAQTPSKSQTEIHKISSVEPFGIVYAAVLTRQALSSTAWSLKDLHFDYRLFTEQLFSLFKDEGNPWVKNLLSWWNRQVCFRKVNNTFDVIEDSEDDQNVVSVNDLLAQAADDPDSDTDTNTIDSDEEHASGLPLSAGTALAPASTFYRNSLLSVFHDAAQTARDRSRADQLEDEQANRRIDQPSSSSLTLSVTASQTTCNPTSAQSIDQHSRNGELEHENQTVPSAGLNSNGKRLQPENDASEEEEERPLPAIHVPTKKRRGDGRTMVGRGGRRTK